MGSIDFVSFEPRPDSRIALRELEFSLDEGAPRLVAESFDLSQAAVGNEFAQLGLETCLASQSKICLRSVTYQLQRDLHDRQEKRTRAWSGPSTD
jgi:hypothetical protein